MEGWDLARLIPIVGGLGALIYLTISHFKGSGNEGKPAGKPLVNQSVQKDTAKVVHSLDIEDLGDNQAFCRCWRSKKFPYCDGSHGKHNQETGDNVGPLCINRKSASS